MKHPLKRKKTNMEKNKKHVNLSLNVACSLTTDDLVSSLQECTYDEIESFDGKGYDENTFYVEGTTIRIPKRPADKLQYINMKLIQTFDSYAETDEVPTVFGKDGIVFRMVLELMAGIRSADDNNDSSSKKIMQNV